MKTCYLLSSFPCMSFGLRGWASCPFVEIMEIGADVKSSPQANIGADSMFGLSCTARTDRHCKYGDYLEFKYAKSSVVCLLGVVADGMVKCVTQTIIGQEATPDRPELDDYRIKQKTPRSASETSSQSQLCRWWSAQSQSVAQTDIWTTYTLGQQIWWNFQFVIQLSWIQLTTPATIRQSPMMVRLHLLGFPSMYFYSLFCKLCV